MSSFFEKLGESLHILVPDEEGVPPEGATTPPLPSSTLTAFAPGSTAGADAATVENIKRRVFSASSVMTAFTATCEKMRQAFPNDESSRMRAALAMIDGNIDKTKLLDELGHTVSAAFEQARISAEKDRTRVRTEKVGPVETELRSTTTEITSLETQLASLQETIRTKRTRVTELTATVGTIDKGLEAQDAVVNASFEEVARYIATLTQTINQL